MEIGAQFKHTLNINIEFMSRFLRTCWSWMTFISKIEKVWDIWMEFGAVLALLSFNLVSCCLVQIAFCWLVHECRATAAPWYWWGSNHPLINKMSKGSPGHVLSLLESLNRSTSFCMKAKHQPESNMSSFKSSKDGRLVLNRVQGGGLFQFICM